jgi:hypothetical protein
MSTELVILFAIFAFILTGVFVGPNGPKTTFEKSAPKLGARLEKEIETGSGFIQDAGSDGVWIPAPKLGGTSE